MESKPISDVAPISIALTLWLEAVVQAELDLPGRGADAADKSETAICYAIVRIPVARNIEEVEEVGTESEDVLFTPEMEILEQGRVHLAVSRTALRAVGSGAELK